MKISLCHCGSTEDNHNYRHEFEHKYWLNYENGVYSIDVNEWNTLKVEECSVSQCSAGRPLHGTIIEHEFSPRVKYSYRNVKIRLPKSVSCSDCSYSLSSHPPYRHPLTIKLRALNKNEHDKFELLSYDKRKVIPKLVDEGIVSRKE